MQYREKQKIKPVSRFMVMVTVIVEAARSAKIAMRSATPIKMEFTNSEVIVLSWKSCIVPDSFEKRWFCDAVSLAFFVFDSKCGSCRLTLLQSSGGRFLFEVLKERAFRKEFDGDRDRIDSAVKSESILLFNLLEWIQSFAST
mmetsp:Transcript_22914/g.34736  ORF Transcript_22914/g.34736 Transcript_22914/m.34736 type:complete len:143 (-) Transcript_22914:76-504(-)